MVRGLPVAPHIGQGQAVYTAATLHTAVSAKTLQVVEFQPTQVDVADRFFTPSLRPSNGFYTLPNQLGLGIEPDLDALRPYVVS